MPHTLKVADLRALCKHFAYSGEDTPKAMKSWAETEGYKLGIDGAEIAVKDMQLEDEPTAGKVFKLAGTPKGGDEPLTDIDAKADAKAATMFTAALKAMGIDPIANRRPNLLTPDKPVTHVKSWQERMYEDRIKAKTARFDTYERAKCFGDFMQSKSYAARNLAEPYQESFKSFAEGFERLAGKSYSTLAGSNGAAYVPEIFLPELVKNVDNYGVYPQMTRVIRTNKSQIILPRNTGGVTAAFVGDNTAITASQSTLDNIELSAKAIKALAQVSNELLADSAINFADDVMDDLARAIAKLKDQCILIGDGSATYGGMSGFTSKYGASASDGGNVVVGGTTADVHTATQLALLIARLPKYALDGAAFACSQAIFGAVFARLLTSTAVGGLVQADLAGPSPYSYMGFPIIVNANIMNSSVNANAAAIDILFGNFGRASKMLDLLDVQLDVDTSYGFNTFSTYFRAVARFHSVVHDVGTSTAAGPVVSFWQS